MCLNLFSRNGSGVEDNPSIRHVEVRALPHESGPSSCARGSPHWVLLETKTSRRRNALRSCSRTQNVKLRLSTWSGSTKTERSPSGGHQSAGDLVTTDPTTAL